MPRYNNQALEEAVKTSKTIKEALIKLDLHAAGGSYRQFKHYCQKWGVDYSHFLTASERAKEHLSRRTKISMEQILIENSTYSRTHLKRRLYKEGYKKRECELCGQGEEWRGKKMSLILDHINGVHNDNRLENLRIVCPNCNATLPTHCGKHRRKVKKQTNPDWRRAPRPYAEKIDWPDNQTLRQMVEDSNYSAVGRKLGVSDNAVRKRLKNHT
jgi:hypothetical protein